MNDNEFTLVNYLENIRGNITAQFRGKPVLDRYLQLIANELHDIQDALYQLQTLRSLHSATGAQLDILGEIVGYPRKSIVREFKEFFGFAGHPNAGTFGSLQDQSIGAPWYSLGQQIATYSEMTDEEYRIVIKSKILKNFTKATVDDVLESCEFLFNEECKVIPIGNATVRIVIPRELTAEEKGLLFNPAIGGSLIPKPTGVKYIVETDSTLNVNQYVVVLQ